MRDQLRLLAVCVLLILVPYAYGCSFQVVQTKTNSWQEGGATMMQYDIVVTNTGEALNVLNFRFSTTVSQSWTATVNSDGSFGLPAWYSAGMKTGDSWQWGGVTAGDATLSAASSPANCAMDYQSRGTSSSSGSGSGSSGTGSSSGGNPTPSSYCVGNPPMYNGLYCASTTRYFDGTTGACGCGVGGDGPFPWQRQQYTAAASQAIFGPEMVTWCGSGCGGCYELTPTGDCPTGGPCATQTAPIVVMVTNLCPYQGNQEWCPNPGNVNQHGYGGHFDLLDSAQLFSNLGWNNPVVTFRQVPCGTGGSPSCSEAKQCQCGTSTCSAGGVASFGLLSNVSIDSSDFKSDDAPEITAKPEESREHVETADKPRSRGPSALAVGMIALGIALFVGILAGSAIYIRRRTAPLTKHMAPLIDYTDNSDL